MQDNHIKISITDRNGNEKIFDAPVDMGLNLMEFCRSVELPLKGECGGMAMCATCHVYILNDVDFKEPSDDELAMLDQAFFVKANSRLSCQIHLQPNINGLRVQMAPEND